MLDIKELRKLYRGTAEVEEQREAGTMSGLETLWNLSYIHCTRDAQSYPGQLGIDWHERTQLLNQHVEAEHP